MPNSKDPFDSLELNDEFVQGAITHELSADERIHRRNTPIEPVGIAGPRRPRPRHRRPGFKWWAAGVGALGLLGIGYWSLDGHLCDYWGCADLPGPPTTAVTDDMFVARDVAGTQPTADPSAVTRLLPAVAPGDDPNHRFLSLRANGAPVTFDACRPLHIVINPAGAPFDITKDVAGVATELSAATGLVITVEGTTDEPPGLNRPPFQPDRYGDQWAPILVAWTDPLVVPALDGSALGFGGNSATTAPEGDQFYVTGSVFLDAEQLGSAEVDADLHALAATALRHGLGHVLGLDHVGDPGQLMSPAGSGARQFGAGDLTGLAMLGNGGCAATP
jgi:hypothetical protein